MAIVPVLMLIALGVYALATSHEQYRARAELLSQNLAAAVAGRLSSDVEKFDLALTTIVDLLERQLASGGLDTPSASALIAAQVRRHPELDGIRVTDRRGVTVIGSSLPGQAPLDMSDRDWFIWQRDNVRDDLHMSAPLRNKLAGLRPHRHSRRNTEENQQGRRQKAATYAKYPRDKANKNPQQNDGLCCNAHLGNWKVHLHAAKLLCTLY